MFNGKIHYKWSFSIAMLVYQRVSNVWMNSRKKPSFGSATWFWGRWKFDKNLISTILVDEIRNIPLLLPLFNGQVEALWLWFNPKNRSSTSSEGKKKIHACFRLYIYINLRMGQSLHSPFTTICPEPRNIHHISLISSSRRGWFSSNFSFLPYLTAPAFNLGNAERPQRWDGSCPTEGGKINRICSGSLTVEKNMVDTWYAYCWKN